jgi:hypothetical protein
MQRLEQVSKCGMILSHETNNDSFTQSRVTFSNIGRSKAGVFRESKAKVNEEQLFRQQVNEMHAVEDKLRQLRMEYDKVCRERGKAHQSAILVKNQEQEIAEFERRRNEIVQKRAERVARNEALKHKQRIAERIRQKEEQLERRKNVFQTDWSPASGDPLRWTNKKTFARELEQLIGLEKTIERTLREKETQQKQRQRTTTTTKTTSTAIPADRCCRERNPSCSCSSLSSCSCSGTSTPTSEMGSVICVEEIAQRVYMVLNKMRQHADQPQSQQSPLTSHSVTQKSAPISRPEKETRKQSKHVREVGVNTSGRTANNKTASNEPPFVLCSSPTESSLSGADDGKQRYMELVQKLNDLSAIESPNEEENVSSYSSEQTVTRDPVTRPKTVALSSEESEPQNQRSPVAVSPDHEISSSSLDSSIPKFPSFDRSYFWKDVFDSAGVSMSETIARVLRDAKRTTHNIEKSLTLLSIPEVEHSQSSAAGDNPTER